MSPPKPTPTPHGPKPIASNGQIVLPKVLLESVGLKAGESVFVIENHEPPGTILVVPERMASTWFAKGRGTR
jgi:bifunctional DNA-binding transcriptional regulator/antitoxin component of YhaV-PrlF toxin-antitoxin module